jgi:hypothetical protein
MTILTEVKFTQVEIMDMIRDHLETKYGSNIQADQIIAMCDDLEASSQRFEIWAQVNVVPIKDLFGDLE